MDLTTFSPYKNKNRAGSNGSQSEKPFLKWENDKFKVGGYQHFVIDKTTLKYLGNYSNKFNFIKSFLQLHLDDCTSLTDIGASNGLVVCMASQLKIPKIYALDHDSDCIKLISQINDKLEFNIIPKQYSFGDSTPKCDIVVMGALIHWIFSCTANYGSFDSIMEYLTTIIGKYLLIEWVDPTDQAIQYFKHIQFNKNIIKEPYTIDNFLKSANKYFKKVEKVCNVTGTRKLYLFTV